MFTLLNKYKKYFLIFLCLITNISVADDGFFQNTVDSAITSFCNEESTLKFINKNNKQCFPYISSLSEKCNHAFKILIPNMDINASEAEVKKNIYKRVSLSMLYATCIKSHIYETKKSNSVSMKYIPQ